MFSRRLQHIEQLKARIHQEVLSINKDKYSAALLNTINVLCWTVDIRNLSITKDNLRGVTNSFRNRLQQYTANRDAHLMDILFKKIISVIVHPVV